MTDDNEGERVCMRCGRPIPDDDMEVLHGVEGFIAAGTVWQRSLHAGCVTEVVQSAGSPSNE
jgi:hypothetical protein